jgi:hypothetical protein
VKVQGGYDRGGHCLGIAHLALGVFVMIKGFQDIVTPTINGYDLLVHGRSSAMKSGLQENAPWAIFNLFGSDSPQLAA